MNGELGSSCDPDKTLLAELGRLSAEADDLWERHRGTSAFHAYASDDYLAVYNSLVRLWGRVLTFLEWDSGLGIITIMASRMRFEAYGIEAEQVLVVYAETFVQAYGSKTRIVQGCFIPDDFEWNPV